ncbi:MAG: 2Fe-2S iron-sulfur cluster binding domain-containing protein [Gammaproteobacteria bacterium]|nr:2Fe-2S iron-sulfur cluster binding domain-containing protein [Gammaproteobacteria bacterium]
MTEFEITAYTRDGQVLTFPCRGDEALLAGAERQNIVLPAQCRKGSCGACTATVRAGSYGLGSLRPNDGGSLARNEREVLLCQATPRSALVVDLPYDHAFVRFEPVPERWAEIVALDRVAPGTERMQLRLQADEVCGSAAEFAPGQYMEILVPGTAEWRAYSLANNTNWDGHLEFLIAQRPDGLFGRYLQRAAVGDRLRVKGPSGVFTLQENGLHPRWFIGGHTGVAPLLSMLCSMAAWGDSHPVRLYFAVRDGGELFLEDAIEELRQRLPQLEVKYCVSRSHRERFHYGNVLETLEADLRSAGTPPDCYVCGSARLVEGVTACARNHGVAEDRIYHERFVAT